MHRTLEALGIVVERSACGLAVRIHTAAERALVAIEGSHAAEHGAALPAGTLLVERRVAGATQEHVIELYGQPSDSALVLCFELLARELQSPDVEPRVVRGLCDVLLGLSLRTSRGTSAEQPSLEAAHGVRDLCVRKALGLLQARLSERWTVERLARELGLSRAALARRFSSATGTSPLRYLAAVRIAEAERLLRQSEEPLSEIARRVGYESEFASNRAFKRLRGVAPGQFRRSLTGRGPVLALAA